MDQISLTLPDNSIRHYEAGITAAEVTAIAAEPCLRARQNMAKPGGFVTCQTAGCKKIMCATVRAAKRHFERHGTASDSPLLRWVQGKIGDINDEAKNNIAARIQAQIEERRAGR